MRTVCIAVLLSLVVATDTFSRDIYVDNVIGDDRNIGSNTVATDVGSGPCRSIRKALIIANRGDRIVIANTGQPYYETITLQGAKHSGYEGLPFEIVGNGAVLDGTVSIEADKWRHEVDGVYRYKPLLMSYQTLYIDSVPAARVRIAKREELTTLEPLQFTVFQGSIYFRPEKNRLPLDYNLACSGCSVGVTLFGVRTVVVQDLLIQGFQLDGVNVHDNVSDASIVSVTSRGNGRSGVSVGGASRARIIASLLGNNSTAQFRSEGYSKTEIINCEIVDDDPTAPGMRIEGGTVVRDGQPVPATR